jgi:hypothetical protein
MLLALMWLLLSAPASAADPPSAATPIEFDTLQTLDGFTLPLHAWSPAADEIALVANDGLYLLAITPTPQAPRRVATGQFRSVAWSADGRSIAARMPHPSGSGDLILIRKDRHDAITLGRDLRFHQMLNLGNGDVRILDDDTGLMRPVAPGSPRLSAPQRCSPMVPLAVRNLRRTGLDVIAMRGTSMVRTALSGRYESVIAIDVFPGCARLLLWIQMSRSATCITDTAGRILETIRDRDFTATSVGHEGDLVFGFVSRDEGDVTVEERVLAYDTSDRRMHSLRGPQGHGAQASRVSDTLAYEGMNYGIVIGRYRRSR